MGEFPRGGLENGPSARAGEDGADGVAPAEAVSAAEEEPGITRGALQDSWQRNQYDSKTTKTNEKFETYPVKVGL